MKKLMCVLLALGLLLSFTACGEKTAPEKTVEGTPEEIAQCPDSYTGIFLKKYFEEHPGQ